MRIRRNFSLVEIVVTIAIIGAVMALAVPSFRGISRERAVKMAASQFRASLFQAQGVALSQQRYVALVLDIAGVGFDKRNQGRPAYRLAYVNRLSASKYPFSGWVENEDWRSFPNGALVAYIGDEKNMSLPSSLTTLKSSVKGTVLAPLPDSIVEDKIATVIFAPNGSLAYSAEDLYILFLNGGTSGEHLAYPDAEAQQEQALRINHFTGRVEYL